MLRSLATSKHEQGCCIHTPRPRLLSLPPLQALLSGSHCRTGYWEDYPVSPMPLAPHVPIGELAVIPSLYYPPLAVLKMQKQAQVTVRFRRALVTYAVNDTALTSATIPSAAINPVRSCPERPCQGRHPSQWSTSLFEI